MPKIVDALEAIKQIRDNSVLCIGGAGAGHAVPDLLLKSLGERYAQSGSPKNLTIIHPCGIGDNNSRGLNHISKKGLIKRNIGGFWGNAPKMIELAKNNDIEAYNFPQGVLSHLIRATAGGETGLLTKIGLDTFVDPRYEGGKVNSITSEDLVEYVNIGKEDFLFYKCQPLDVVFIRGTSVDKEGNLTMEDEVATLGMLSMAQAARVNGGIVVAQVKNINSESFSKPDRVKVPGVLIDYIVKDPQQTMTFLTQYEKAFINRNAQYWTDELSLEGIKQVVSRRAAMELENKDLVNLGYGMPDGIPIVAKNEDVLEKVTFLIEQGPIGGVISTGLNFGAMYNPSAIIDDGYQFDFFHGGGLDVCFLGFAQIDIHGNVNSSRFGDFFTGCGGFIDISQNTKRVVFCGSFATKATMEIEKEELILISRGKNKKFINQVEQITFNGKSASLKGQKVIYCTERAVFELSPLGIVLIEIAPGIDLQKDILDMMEFKPIISDTLKTMDSKIFGSSLMGLKNKLC